MAKQCRHIKASGVQCRAYRVWKEDYCFFHLHHRKPQPIASRSEQPPAPAPKTGVLIPLLEDLASVQVAITRVLTALAEGKITPAEAQAFLSGLRLASTNLRHAELTPRNTAECFVQYENGDVLGAEQFPDEAKPEHPILDPALISLRHLAQRIEYEATIDAHLVNGQQPPETLQPPVRVPTGEAELREWIDSGWKLARNRTVALDRARRGIDGPAPAARPPQIPLDPQRFPFAAANQPPQ